MKLNTNIHTIDNIFDSLSDNELSNLSNINYNDRDIELLRMSNDDFIALCNDNIKTLDNTIKN